MNKFEDIWNEYKGPEINKWTNYFNLYDEIFSKYRDRPINFLEIGINHGGSLEIWKRYFHVKSNFYGIDINPECKKLEKDNVKIFIGSQNDRNFLNSLKEKGILFDIIIDDGGHKMSQQIVSHKELFPILKDGGVYLCEDTHTSYWKEFGGGYKKSGTFMEFSKSLIDSLYYYHMPTKIKSNLQPNLNLHSVHFYDGLIAFYKSNFFRSQPIRKGYKTLTEYKEPRENCFLRRILKLLLKK